MTAEGAALQAWFDQSASHMTARVGKGRASHYSPGNDETLCGKPISAYVSLADALNMPGVCGPCYNKAIKIGAAALASKGEKMTDTVDPAKLKEEITALAERITAVAIAGEDVAPLKEEAEELIGKLPTKERTKLRNQIRKAAESKPAPAEPITVSSEMVTRETIDPRTIEGYAEYVEAASKAFAGGVAAQLKTGGLAREVASTLLELRTKMTDKDGRPDILATSRGAKEASNAILTDAAKLAGLNPKEDPVARDAIAKFGRAVQHQMDDVRVKYIRALDANPEEAAKFAKVLEAAPAADAEKPSDAVFAAYDLNPQSKVERMALETASAKADDGASKPRIVTWIDTAEEELVKAGKSDPKNAKLTDDQRKELKAKIEKIKSLAVSLEMQL